MGENTRELAILRSVMVFGGALLMLVAVIMQSDAKQQAAKLERAIKQRDRAAR